MGQPCSCLEGSEKEDPRWELQGSWMEVVSGVARYRCYIQAKRLWRPCFVALGWRYRMARRHED